MTIHGMMKMRAKDKAVFYIGWFGRWCWHSLMKKMGEEKVCYRERTEKDLRTPKF